MFLNIKRNIFYASLIDGKTHTPFKWYSLALRKSGSVSSWKHRIEYPASREMLDRRQANVVTYVGATSANDVGPTWICPLVQHWHNVVTPPKMTLCQRFANAITYCILLYRWLVIRLHTVYVNGWLSIGITSLLPIACRRLRLRYLVLYERLWHNCWTNNSTY